MTQQLLYHKGGWDGANKVIIVCAVYVGAWYGHRLGVPQRITRTQLLAVFVLRPHCKPLGCALDCNNGWPLSTRLKHFVTAQELLQRDGIKEGRVGLMRRHAGIAHKQDTARV